MLKAARESKRVPVEFLWSIEIVQKIVLFNTAMCRVSRVSCYRTIFLNSRSYKVTRLTSLATEALDSSD